MGFVTHLILYHRVDSLTGIGCELLWWTTEASLLTNSSQHGRFHDITFVPQEPAQVLSADCHFQSRPIASQTLEAFC